MSVHIAALYVMQQFTCLIVFLVMMSSSTAVAKCLFFIEGILESLILCFLSSGPCSVNIRYISQ